MLALSGSVIALEFEEKLKVKVLHILDDNVVILSRGLEDDINEEDHIHIRHKNQVLARAICISAGMQTSYWKVYRTINPRLIQAGKNYEIQDIQRMGIAPDQLSIDKKKYEKQFQRFSERKWAKQERRKNIGKIERLIKHRIQDDQTEEGENFEQSLDLTMDQSDKRRFQNDFDQASGQIFIAPLQRQSINKNEQLNFGAELGNLKQGKYDLRLGFEQQYSSQEDTTTRTSVSSRVTSAFARYQVKRMLVKTDYFSFINYYQEKHTDIAPIQQRIRFAPFGLRYWFVQSTKVPQFTLAYSPFIENQITEKLDYSRGNPETGDIPIEQNNRTVLRHLIELVTFVQLSDNILLSNSFSVAPLHELGTLAIDFTDLSLVNNTSLQFKINPHISVDLSNIYERDKSRAEDTDLPESNFIQMVNFNYFFNL